MPTIRRCCIIGCPSNSRHNPALQFFQFPKPENPFHKLWKNACHASLSRILPFKKPVVCALHFHPNCVGGRRLTSNAVPSLRLEIPSNMKVIEQQAMVEEIERSRKCAYINAVVYEWLVRANLNPQLRGSITHGMIKEKAEAAKQLVGSDTFIVDNRWLNRFRETHLTGFAQKLANNQLKPLGPSLWIPDIVQDLQHLFPPTSAERMANFENVPEHYMNYMQQYGEYEEDDDLDLKDASSQEPASPYSHPQQQSQQPPQPAYEGFAGLDNNFHADRKSQGQQAFNSSWLHSSRSSSPTSTSVSAKSDARGPSPGQQKAGHGAATAKRPRLQADHDDVQLVTPNGSTEHLHAGEPIIDHIDITQGDDGPDTSDSNSQFYSNSNSTSDSNSKAHAATPAKQHNTSTGSSVHSNEHSSASTNNHHNNTATSELSSSSNNNNTASNGSPRLGSPPSRGGVNGGGRSKDERRPSTNGFSRYSVASSASGRTPSSSPAPSTSSKLGRSETNGMSTPVHELKEIDSYAEALEYMRPIEQFVLMQENFRAIGLLAQLEKILRSGESAAMMRRIAKN